MKSLIKSGQNGHEATLEYPSKEQRYTDKSKKEKEKELPGKIVDIKQQLLIKLYSPGVSKHLLRLYSYKSHKEHYEKMKENLERKASDRNIEIEITNSKYISHRKFFEAGNRVIVGVVGGSLFGSFFEYEGLIVGAIAGGLFAGITAYQDMYHKR